MLRSPNALPVLIIVIFVHNLEVVINAKKDITEHFRMHLARIHVQTVTTGIQIREHVKSVILIVRHAVMVFELDVNNV